MKTEAISVMQPQAKEHWDTLEAGRGKEGFSSSDLRRECGPAAP